MKSLKLADLPEIAPEGGRFDYSQEQLMITAELHVSRYCHFGPAQAAVFILLIALNDEAVSIVWGNA